MKRKLLHMTILPMVTLIILVLVCSVLSTNKAISSRQRQQLQSNARQVIETLEERFPGDYFLAKEEVYRIYKGEEVISEQTQLLDELRLSEEFELTLFYEDTRILTTLRDEEGNRFVGTGASGIVLRDVLQNGEERFYSSVDVDGVKYHTYYAPLFHSDGSICGMIGVACPVSADYSFLFSFIWPLLTISLIATVFAIMLTTGYTRKLVGQMEQLHKFMGSVASGNLSVDLDEKILKQRDEIGELGRAGVEMRASLRRMVELDELTKINNRRFGQKRMEYVQKKAVDTGVAACVAIGDIDFFKKINDTYGHEAGDEVLCAVASTLREGMLGNGFVARWGGEEFLMIFDHSDLEQTMIQLDRIRQKIEDLEPRFEGTLIKVTISIGVAALDVTAKVDENIKRADECLYQAKEGGRNRVVGGNADA